MHGDGTMRRLADTGPRVAVVAGTTAAIGTTNASQVTQSGAPASSVVFDENLVGTSVTPDGTIWLLSAARLLRVGPDSMVHLACSNANGSGWGSASGTAITTTKTGGILLAVSDASAGRLLEMAAGETTCFGTNHWVAGSNTATDPTLAKSWGQGVHPVLKASSVRLVASGLAEGPDGARYLVTAGADHRIWRLDGSGVVMPIAGTETSNPYEYSVTAGQSALAARLWFVDRVAVDPAGTVYAGLAKGAVVAVSPSGVISPVATLPSGYASALTADMNFSGFASPTPNNLSWCQVNSSGPRNTAFLGLAGATGFTDVSRLFGTGQATVNTDQSAILAGGSPGDLTFAACRAVARGPDGSWLLSGRLDTWNSDVVLRTRPSGLPTFGTSVLVPSEDGRTFYEFDPQGRHLSTKDATTGQQLLQFTYDSAGRLATIVEPFSRTTAIHRSTTSGRPDSITSPDGLVTTLVVDGDGEDGLLKAIINPGQEQVLLAYASSPPDAGLLTAFQTPAGDNSSFAWSGGRLVKDTGATGNFKSLARTDNPANLSASVSVQTKLGRTSSHGWTRTSDGALVRTHTGATGEISQTWDFATARTVNASGQAPGTGEAAHRADALTVSAAGAATWTKYGASRQWGALVRVPAETLTRYSPTCEVHSTFAETFTLDSAGLPTATTQTTVLFSSSPGNSTWKSEKTLTNGQWKTTTTSPTGLKSWTQYRTDHLPDSSGGTDLPTVTWSYDTVGRPLQMSIQPTDTGAARTVTYTWNSTGQLATVSAGGQTVTTSYDAAGRPSAVDLPDHATIYFGRDGAGRVTDVTPPATSPPADSFGGSGPPTYNFGYGKGSLLKGETLPAAAPFSEWQTLYTYNDDRELLRKQRPDGSYFEAVRDPSDRVTSVTIPDDTVVGGGTVTTTIGYVGTTSRIASVAAGGATLSYGYNGALPKSETWSGSPIGPVSGAAVERGIDDRARLSTLGLHVSGGTGLSKDQTVTVSYDLDDRPVKFAIKDNSGNAHRFRIQNFT